MPPIAVIFQNKNYKIKIIRIPIFSRISTYLFLVVAAVGSRIARNTIANTVGALTIASTNIWA